MLLTLIKRFVPMKWPVDRLSCGVASEAVDVRDLEGRI
jgi:hypothetical protein